MKKIGVCGYFAYNLDDFGGQPVKTRLFYKGLENIFGKNEIFQLDTLNWKSNPINFFTKCIIMLVKCESIVILPAFNGVKILVPLLSFMNIFLKRKLHYVVIGGWIVELLKNKKLLINALSRFNGIYVETNTMKINLENFGMNNVYIIPNFKNINAISIDQITHYTKDSLYNFCTFSRVIKEKGIEDAINAIVKINNENYKVICTLDIYGQIHESYLNEFKQIINSAPSYIKYKGVVDTSKSVNVLKSYFIQLFPTHYKTEGIPGSIIDSFFAGLPVIASKWNSFYDVIDDMVTGIGYEFGDFDDFYSKINWSINNYEAINKMKYNCIEKSEEYTLNEAMRKFMNILDEEDQYEIK